MAHSAGHDPLLDVLSRLVRDGTLTDAQAAKVDEALRTAGLAPDTRRSTAAEILTYLGAALTVGALALVVGLSWDELGQAGQLATSAGVTVLFAGLAVVVGRWRGSVFEHRRRPVAAVLAALAAAAAALTTGQVADTLGVLDEAWTVVAIGAVVVAAGVAAYAAWRAAPSVVVWFVGGLVVAGGVLELTLTGGDTTIYYGSAFYLYGAGSVAYGRLLRHPHVTGVLGGVTATAAAEALAFDTPWLGLVLGLVAVAGLFAVFRLDRRWWYAAVGVLGTLVVPATAVGQLWSGTLAALVLLAVGVLLVLAALVLARNRGRSA